MQRKEDSSSKLSDSGPPEGPSITIPASPIPPIKILVSPPDSYQDPHTAASRSETKVPELNITPSSAKAHSPTTLHYNENTKAFVFDMANMCLTLMNASKKSDLKPVIMIDGPAGTGKSTFTKELVRRLRELKVNVCQFDQDNFGMDRETRKKNAINQCSDLARDPQTVTKLIEVMAGKTTFVPSYNKRIGKRIPNQVPIPTGDIIVYEGISCLSSVIYENAQFNNTLKKQVPIKIFFRPDNEETLFKSRMKREFEERGVHPVDFIDNWDESARSNWLFTFRGIVNANFIVTRDSDNHFKVAYVKPVVYQQQRIPSPYSLASSVSQQLTERMMVLERQHFIRQNLDQWFHSYNTALHCAFVFEDLLLKEKIDPKIALTMRDDLMNFLVIDLVTQKNLNKTLAMDDISVPIFPTRDSSSSRGDPNLHRGFLRQGAMDALIRNKPNPIKAKMRKGLSQDDIALNSSSALSSFGSHKKYLNLFTRGLSHDMRFNNKYKIAAENALAATVVDEMKEVIPSVLKVSQTFLELVIPLANKFKQGTATEAESAIILFLLEPFEPHARDAELGRMLVSSKEHPSKKELLEWLMHTLINIREPYDLHTHMRFHIRFMHLIAEKNTPSLPSTFMESHDQQHFQQLLAQLKHSCMFSTNDPTVLNPEEKRGRIISSSKKYTNLSRTFGTHEDLHDLPMSLRKIIGYRTLPPHSAGKEFITPISTTQYNQDSFKQDIPGIASGSGAMAFIMCAATFCKLNPEELMRYHLAAIVQLVGGGHHSLNECVGVSQACIPFTSPTIGALIPPSLRGKPAFANLIHLTDGPEFQPLWTPSTTPTPTLTLAQRTQAPLSLSPLTATKQVASTTVDNKSPLSITIPPFSPSSMRSMNSPSSQTEGLSPSSTRTVASPSSTVAQASPLASFPQSSATPMQSKEEKSVETLVKIQEAFILLNLDSESQLAQVRNDILIKIAMVILAPSSEKLVKDLQTTTVELIQKLQQSKQAFNFFVEPSVEEALCRKYLEELLTATNCLYSFKPPSPSKF